MGEGRVAGREKGGNIYAIKSDKHYGGSKEWGEGGVKRGWEGRNGNK